jgi:hypothetical protein
VVPLAPPIRRAVAVTAGVVIITRPPATVPRGSRRPSRGCAPLESVNEQITCTRHNKGQAWFNITAATVQHNKGQNGSNNTAQQRPSLYQQRLTSFVVAVITVVVAVVWLTAWPVLLLIVVVASTRRWGEGRNVEVPELNACRQSPTPLRLTLTRLSSP